MPAKLKEVKDKYQKIESEKGSRKVSNKVCQKVSAGAERAALAEAKHVEVSNKVCQKVQQGAERAATAKRQKVDDLQDSNKVC